MSGVREQVGEYGAQQSKRDLLSVQTEDAVEQLYDPTGPLLSSFLKQFLKQDTGSNMSEQEAKTLEPPPTFKHVIVVLCDKNMQQK